MIVRVRLPEPLYCEKLPIRHNPIQGMYSDNQPDHWVNGLFFPYGDGCEKHGHCGSCPFEDCVKSSNGG